MSVMDTLFQDADILAIIGASLIASTLFFILILTIFIHIMHLFLYRRFDPILFNNRWFTHAELNIYSLWPLSLIRSVIYMFLIAFPNLAIKTKRFKGFDLTLPVSPSLKVVSKIYIVLHYLTVMIGIAMFLSMFAFYIVEEFF